MINLNKLEIFALVVRTGSFSAAAEHLLMTQPAVSQHIQDLEASLGTRLFVRGRRGVTLTPAGETLAAYAHTIFQLASEAERAVTDVEHLAAGEMRLGATPGVSAYLLPEPIQAFHARYPNLSVIVQTMITPEILAELLAGRLDLGLIEGELAENLDPRIGVQPLEAVAQRVVVGRQHPWWGRTEVAFEALGQQLLITRQRHSQTRIWLDALLSERGIRPRIGAEFDNMESIKRAVANGKSVAVLPDYAVQAEIEGGMLWSPGITGAPLQRTLKLVWNRESPLTPVAQAWLHCVAGHLPGVNIAAIAGK